MIPLTCPRVFRECSMYHMFPAVFQGAEELWSSLLLTYSPIDPPPKHQKICLRPCRLSGPLHHLPHVVVGDLCGLCGLKTFGFGHQGFGALGSFWISPHHLGNEGKDPHSSPNIIPITPSPIEFPKIVLAKPVRVILEALQHGNVSCPCTLITKP